MPAVIWALVIGVRAGKSSGAIACAAETVREASPVAGVAIILSWAFGNLLLMGWA